MNTQGKLWQIAQFGWQIGKIDLLPRRHDGQPVTDVFQLPHVARKIKCCQMTERRIGEALGLDPQIVRALLQKK